MATLRLRFSALAGMHLIVLLYAGGCVRIPFPERVVDAGPAGDFRNDFGPAGSDKPLRVDGSNRDAVVRRLGEPEVLSADGTTFGYTLGTVSDLRIFLPLFFLPSGAEAHAYGLRVEFGPDGYIHHYEISRIDEEINNGLICATSLDRTLAVERMNWSEPIVYFPSELSVHIRPTTQPGGGADRTRRYVRWSQRPATRP